MYTPSTAGADLEAHNVGRTALLDILSHRITAAARDGSRPHTLLLAPRGGGKTHTLHLSMHRALAETQTATRTLPVVIPEDSLAIGSYADLLVEIARAIDPELAGQARALRRLHDPVGIEAAVLHFAGERMILLAVENLDRIFDAIGTAGQGNLRAWVETSTAVLVFATAPQRFPGMASREYPWYGSFSVEEIPGMGLSEAAELLGRAGDSMGAYLASAEGRERLSVLHRLLGGSPRTWLLLAHTADVSGIRALVPAVEGLLDRLAPDYQQRLWQLPPGEQRLVVELARGWEPRTVTDLAEAVGISNQSASAALGRLAAQRWVVASKAPAGDRRTSWYDLTDPLLRYHLRYRDNTGLTENDIRAVTHASVTALM
ncbi:hypothetical protein BH11ACT6_BH11ACT6_36240 [soil metagenome]